MIWFLPVLFEENLCNLHFKEWNTAWKGSNRVQIRRWVQLFLSGSNLFVDTTVSILGCSCCSTSLCTGSQSESRISLIGCTRFSATSLLPSLFYTRPALQVVHTRNSTSLSALMEQSRNQKNLCRFWTVSDCSSAVKPPLEMSRHVSSAQRKWVSLHGNLDYISRRTSHLCKFRM